MHSYWVETASHIFQGTVDAVDIADARRQLARRYPGNEVLAVGRDEVEAASQAFWEKHGRGKRSLLDHVRDQVRASG